MARGPGPQNPAEAWVFQAQVWTWPLYFIGALYVVGPVLGWVLAGVAVLSLYLGPAMRTDLRATGVIPPVVWAWILGMAAMLVVLWLGHLDWGLGLKKTIKSSVGWAKGWALLALFPLIGAVLPIRRAVLVRGQCIVGAWTLALLPLLLLAPYVGLPERMFTSPLKAVGGPGPEYFTFFLYTIDPGSGVPRWQFFAPWSPFAALLGVVMVLFALEERDRRWMAAGVLAGVVMILASKSRMGLVGLVACTMGPRLMPLMVRSWGWFVLSAVTTSMAALGGQVLQGLTGGVQAFRSARADSTRVRESLQNIAYERWHTEALWFGHGTVQPGSHYVEYMPIGSHHTWFGLLFVKGMVGFLALLVPLIWQIGLALKDAAMGPRGRLPLGIVMTLVLLSFGENIEIEAYLLWPGLILLGIHAREIERAGFAKPAPAVRAQAKG